MSQLDELVERTPASFRSLAWLIMALLAAIGVWAYLAEFEEVAIAQGAVVPQGQVKVIQHLEGGIIEGIYIVDGDEVAAGTPLVQLNLTALGANREELAVRLDSSLLARARLVAEASAGKERRIEAHRKLLAVGAQGREVELDQRRARGHFVAVNDVNLLDDAAFEVLDHLDLALRHHRALGDRHLLELGQVGPHSNSGEERHDQPRKRPERRRRPFDELVELAHAFASATCGLRVAPNSLGNMSCDGPAARTLPWSRTRMCLHADSISGAWLTTTIVWSGASFSKVSRSPTCAG